jgi:hypothetical protein
MAKKLGATLIAFAAISTTHVAKAEPRGVDWGKLVLELDQVARGNADKGPNKPSKPARPLTPTEDPAQGNLGNAWFGVAPRVTLVARDWGNSFKVAGDRLSLTDAMRLSASTRMVVGRARLSNTRFTPFVQAGLGQWRIDRAHLPLMPSLIDVAAQVGGGFELRMTKHWQLAAEASGTTLFRESTAREVPQSMLWSTLLASRIEF